MKKKISLVLLGACTAFATLVTACEEDCEHVWDAGVITTPSTFTMPGVKTYTCTICGKTKTDSIPVGQSDANNGARTAAAYDLVTSLDNLSEAYIVTSNNGSDYVGMTATAKSDDLPWYLVGVDAQVSSDKVGADIKGDAEKFKFTKQSDGTYTIQATNNDYLCCYIDGTHYSIGMFAESKVASNCKFWTITTNANGFTMKGKTVDVYLSYSDKASFCGNKTAPSVPIYLYIKGTGSGTGEGGGTGTTTGGGTVVMPEKDTKWNLNFTQYGTTFRNTLASLIEGRVTSTTNYSSCLGIGMKAAANGSGKYTPFYHGSDYAVTTSTGSNREHTWPNSRGGGDKRGGENIERDPFMVRPTITDDNSSRGNNFYGTGSNEWDPASCGFEAARGESARVIFYVATRYGQSNGLSLSNNPRDDASKKTMGTLKYLIQWNKKYPVTDMEKQINNYLDNQGYGRNPFVDHPEYADFIWDENGIRTSAPNITTSGDITTGGTTTGGTTTGGTTTGGTTTGGTTIGGTTTGGTTGGSTKTYDYTLIDALNDIDNASAYIVGTNDGKKYYTMTNINPGADLPWYFNGVTATLSSDKKGLNTSSVPLKFTFSKQSDGTYTIKNSNNEYLYSYVDGTHYSIGMSTSTDSSSIKSGTINWNISTNSDGYTIKSPLNVYLYLGNPSFGGTKTAPSYPIYLYK